MRPSPRILLVGAAVLVAAALVAVAVVAFLAPRGLRIPGATDEPAPTWAPPAPPPSPAADGTGERIATLADPAWVEATSRATGIPPRALAAYAGATMWKAEMMPDCGLAWNTLAAIGAVESDHGRHGGSTVGPDGTVTPPIYGVALDGSETAHIPDSDGGEIDGDPEFDRAVGPLQMIPETWRNWHADGNGDGVHDPQNLDDQARSAVNYLCRVTRGIDTEEGWRTAIAGYNPSSAYVDAVARRAVRYAEAAG